MSIFAYPPNIHPLPPHPDITVLSVAKFTILSMLDTRDANALRLVCNEFKNAVSWFHWRDEKTVIRGSVKSWRACFPRAVWANIGEYYVNGNTEGRRTHVKNKDFQYLVGLEKLDMSYCERVTNDSFAHLLGIHSLNMTWCAGITDAGLQHLQGILIPSI